MTRVAHNKGKTQFPTLQAFLEKTRKEKNGCVYWTGTCCPKGYGKSHYKGETRTHRISWMLFKGDIPKGLHVLHKCDHPSCVNIKHLYLGTNQDNMNDRTLRGRTVVPDNRGEKSGTAKLNINQVNEIRSAKRGTITVLAASFGISRSAAYAIRTGARWNK
jgi:hypothetical protein